MSDKESAPVTKQRFAVGQEMLAQTAQTMLELKKMGRSIENAADALKPLTDDEEVTQMLDAIATHGTQAAHYANQLYHLIAKGALRP